MESKLRHLEMLQGIINRMTQNSFSLKNWAMTLVISLLVLIGIKVKNYLLFIAYIPIIILWFLDSYYLYQERLFRRVYDNVRILKCDEIDFSMNTTSFKQKNDYIKSLFSKTEILFYGVLFIIYTLIIVLLKTMEYQ